MSRTVPAVSDRHGMAIAMAVVITGICVVIISGLTQYIVSEYRAAHLDWRQVQALYCAEAGIEYALGHIRRGESVPETEVALAHAGVTGTEGTFRLEAEAVTSAGVPDPEGSIRVTATGYVPSEADVAAGQGVSRRVVAVVTTGVWDFGVDAVRARLGVEYGSNANLTAVVDEDGNVIDPAPSSVDAGIRVTGDGGTLASVTSVASNNAEVAGSVVAPGNVDILDGNARGISENDPDNYVTNAFPDPATLGYDNGNPADLIWPPAPGTWAQVYYEEALAGGATAFPAGPVQAPQYIELGGSGVLSNITLTGPGTIFVHGHLGGGITNGPPAATIVASGTLYTKGSEVYRCDTGTAGTAAPPLILFGRDPSQGWSAQIRGSSTWDLRGPLISLHPQGEVWLDGSAIGCLGALVSNGTVHFKSKHAVVGFPRILGQVRSTVRSLPVVRSYSAQ